MQPGSLVVKQNPTTLDSLKLGLVIGADVLFNHVKMSLVLWALDGHECHLKWALTDSLLLIDDDTAERIASRCQLRL